MQLKTSQSLLDTLKKAAKSHKLSPSEVRSQRLSFIVGTLDEKISMPRDEILQIIDAHTGTVRA